MASPAAVTQPRKKALSERLRGGDMVAYLLTIFFATLILLVTVYIVYELWMYSLPTLKKFGFSFIGGQIWDPNPDKNVYGALPFIYGTLVTSIVALLISVPLGVGAAIYLSELAEQKLSNILTFLVELLAAVPSVIYGLLAIFTLVPLMRDYIGPFLEKFLGWTPFFQSPIYGTGYLTAGLVLAVMTFPFIISVSREALMAVPREQREAALALGATQWESTYQIVLPYAKLGIIGSVFLGLARALGETMAVTMVIGNDTHIHASLLNQGYTIAALVANEFNEAGDVQGPALVELCLVLFVMTMLINAGARLMITLTTSKGSARA